MKRVIAALLGSFLSCTCAPVSGPEVDGGDDGGAPDSGSVDSSADAGPLARWTTPYPSPRRGQSMVWDSRRQRILMFGGSDMHRQHSDLWVWDGNAWLELKPPTSPSRREWSAAAYDSARDRLVIFGGFQTVWHYDGGVSLSTDTDTWEYDGLNWEQRFPITSPPAKFLSRMTYDVSRQRVVLLGGGRTWEWDGKEWQDWGSGPPEASLQPLMAYDAARARVVVFVAGETWERVDTTWVHRTSATSPGFRDYAAFAFDPVRGRIVLNGGYTTSGSDLDDTWEWDGANWAKPVTAGPVPPGRQDHEMVFDRKRGSMLLFGGDNTNLFYAFSDTWERAGVNWLPRSSSPQFGPSRMAFDAARGRAVNFGGASSALAVTPSSCPDQTWEWNRSRWEQRFPPMSPKPRCDSALAFDPVRQRTVLFGGGFGDTQFSDTWEWDGVSWTLRTPLLSPPARSGHLMTFDPTHGRIVMFGGWSRSSDSSLSDLWEWDGTNWIERAAPLAPPPNLSFHALQGGIAYDETRNRLVVSVGGGTWEWDGSAWSGGTASPGAPGDYMRGMGWDPVRHRTVAYVWPSRVEFQTWEWDGRVWMQRAMAPAGAAPWGASMAWDPLRQQLMLFDGATWFLKP